jgi:uncharacterized protein (DUF1501 family)
MTLQSSRRQFLRTACALAATGVASPLAINLAAIGAASAQSATDFKALVYFYLGGGNDHLSMYVPFDTTSYNRYNTIRGSLALPRASLLPLTATSPQGGRQIGFSGNMVDIKALYDAQRVAVLANVGTLVQPVTKPQVLAGTAVYPRQLNSHYDQAISWSALDTANPFGWGGRMGDLFAPGNGSNSLFTTISANGGFTQLLVGEQAPFFTVNESGAPQLFYAAGSNYDAVINGSAQRTNLLEKAYSQVNERLRDGAIILGNAILPESQFPAPPASLGVNSGAQQLLTVARIVGAQAVLGIKRQVFYVDLGSGFDSHNGQGYEHPRNMTRLNEALSYFDVLLGQLNMRNNVTLFTGSEFGRTLIPNGDGTDHGWAAHHLVLGGKVAGGNIYGALPTIEPEGPNFISGGNMIPTTSVEQYAATLGKWMGVSDTNLNDIFPHLNRFTPRDLGFMVA